MPELPEVENTRRYLIDSCVEGVQIISATVTWGNSVKHPQLEDFILDIRGEIIQSVGRRGKYILLTLTSGRILVLHLGMTGGIRVQNRNQKYPDMLRHFFDLHDSRQIRFIDPRKFGHIWLVDDFQQVSDRMGPEPLERIFTTEALRNIVRARRIPIKALLLDQTAIAGIGNLYADEALFLSGIYPGTIAADLNDSEVEILHTSIISTLEHSINLYDVDRKTLWPEPSFVLRNWSMTRVMGGPCIKCQAPMNMLKVRGRSSYYCPQCQLNMY
jgi:formamidopyrimidine-DNA glycosylase